MIKQFTKSYLSERVDQTLCVHLNFATYTYLHEEYVSCGICPSMHHKSLLLYMAASAWPYGKLPSVLQ